RSVKRAPAESSTLTRSRSSPWKGLSKLARTRSISTSPPQPAASSTSRLPMLARIQSPDGSIVYSSTSMHLAALAPVALVAEVAAQPADRADARALGAALRHQLELAGVRVVAGPASGSSSASGGLGGDSELSAQIVMGALAEARKLSASFEESRAVATLERAEVAYRRAPGADPRPLIDLLLMRARIQFDIGHTADTRTALRRVAVLDLDRKLDPGEYEPRLLALWNAERKGAARTHATLAVEGEGQVMVAGVVRGPAPQTVAVPAGEHLVCMAAGGGQMPAVEVVALPTGSTRTVRPPSPPSGEARPRDLRAAARAANATAIVEATLRREAGATVLEARLLDVASGRTLATARGTPETVAAALAGALRAQGAT